jgi:hypothetical protein
MISMYELLFFGIFFLLFLLIGFIDTAASCSTLKNLHILRNFFLVFNNPVLHSLLSL